MNGRTVTLLGDLTNGRMVHSLVTLLCTYSVRLDFVSPASLAMPANVVPAARKAGVHAHERMREPRRGARGDGRALRPARTKGAIRR